MAKPELFMGKSGERQPQLGEINSDDGFQFGWLRYGRWRPGRRSVAKARAGNRQRLTYEETYRCPACASGELRAIALMDVFACDFCRHMFSANLENQSVHLADSLQPMAWRWNGWQWKTSQQSDTAAGLIWSFTLGLVLMPVGIIVLSNYVFPPLDSSGFPKAWTMLTLACHSTIARWLLAEYHRWPWYISSRIRLSRLRERLFPAEA